MRIFLRKLSMLSKVCKESDNIGSHIFSEIHQNSLKLASDSHTDALLRDTSSLNETSGKIISLY